MITILSLLIGIFVGGFFSHLLAKRREVATRLFEEKRKVYQPYFNFIHDFFLQEKKEVLDGIDEMLNKLKIDVLAYGSNEVIDACNQVGLIDVSNPQNPDINPIKSIETLLRAMRKDLGHPTYKDYLFSMLNKKYGELNKHTKEHLTKVRLPSKLEQWWYKLIN